MFGKTAKNLKDLNDLPLGRTMFRMFAVTLASSAGLIAALAGANVAWNRAEERRQARLAHHNTPV